MVKWLRFNMHQIESPIVQKPVHSVANGNPGAGMVCWAWQTITPPGFSAPLTWKTGDSPTGFHAYMGFNADEQKGVVILTNFVNAPAKLAVQIIEML